MQENTNFERKSILLHTRIGLEIHITTDSKKKVFNFNDTYKGTESNNSLVGSWELGYLGVLPLVNPEVIALGLKLALALKMKEISKVIEFDRKIYTFPDLPIGYQITQNTNPLARNGSFRTVISQENFFDVFVRSLQIEADTARSIHEGDQTYLDFNRSGNPLIELVTEPCFKTAEEVTSFLEQLQTLLVYLDISEAKMEKGQFRVDLNLSFFANEIDYSTPRYEIKNLNSLKNIKECLEFETWKHNEIFLNNQTPPESQTFGFNKKDQKEKTIALRAKTDYYYLPETNIPLIKISSSDLKNLEKKQPTLPSVYWENNQMDKMTSNLFLKDPFFCKFVSLFENSLPISEQSRELALFYLNFLSSRLSSKNFFLFRNKVSYFFNVFEIWKKKEFENKDVSSLVDTLLTKGKKFSVLLKKMRKKENAEDSKNSIEIYLDSLWNYDLEKLNSLNPNKCKNFILGKMREKYSNYNFQEIIKIVDDFLSRKNS